MKTQQISVSRSPLAMPYIVRSTIGYLSNSLSSCFGGYRHYAL